MEALSKVKKIIKITVASYEYRNSQKLIKMEFHTWDTDNEDGLQCLLYFTRKYDDIGS